MLGYEDVLNADLSALSTAATDWESMAKKYEGVQHRLENEVLTVTGGQNLWMGSAAGAAHQHVLITKQQTIDAQTEARAVSTIIADAHADFEAAQKKLKAAAADAAADGMKVTGTGQAVFDTSQYTPAERNAMHHDPGYMEERNAAAGRWTQQINAALAEATAADERASLALKRASKAGDPFNTFNGQAIGGGDAADGRRAADLAEKLKKDGKLEPGELAELNNLMKANANNPQYGQTLLNTLGPEGTLKLADQLEKIGGDRDAKNKEGYGQLQTNLANTVAGATRDPNSKFYQDWRKGMKDIGDKNLGRNTSPVYGYQALATLMDKGDAQYSKEYLNDLGADIIDVEKKHPQIWSHQFDGERQDLVSDPLDGVLKQMGKNPEAATGFLDPDSPGAKDRLDYLLRDRKWPENYMNPLYGAPIKMDDPLQRAGLGAALEAATTGDPTGTAHNGGSHTPAQARVMQGTIDALDQDSKGQEIPDNLRKPIAGALTDYVDDTHDILGAELSTAKHKDGAWEEGGKGHLSDDSSSLTRVMRGVSDDPEAYAALYEAEKAKSAQVIGDLPADAGRPDHDRTGPTDRSGSALGTLDAIRSDILLDERDDKKEWADKTGELVSSGGGLATGYIPVVGDVAGSLVDLGVSNWSDGVKEEAVDKANSEASSSHDANLNQGTQMVIGWAEHNGLDPKSELANEVNTSLRDGHNRGYDEAMIALGRHGSAE
ncbi:hypothetical protein GCM10010495_25450 [Kitasatospora herbaricolor]|uniref:DUF6571 family protein n=1 Tax=Kitasatospora herbaricolor TaxID=68217 RepID=UPI001749DA1C|nr:DUF6571 family protein [Kitasatospora herbaricolor]MDQ0311252.1 hypothetical protein [Kitasatospora herbaricolor]GGV11071.1 hypothetical protein GCM10010495_25450 [Kitasatospora herbaricolor]